MDEAVNLSMAELLNTDNLSLFLYFVVPGFVAMKVYDLIVPSERRKFGESVIEVVSFSMLNLGLTFWIIAEINNPEFRFNNPVLYYFATFLVVSVVPAALAIATSKLLTSRFLRGIILHPTPTGWDYFFAKGQACWILFHLKSGTKLGGLYGENSFASSFPNEQEIYVQEIWRVDELGRFVEKVEGTAGTIIKREECKLIELFTKDE